MWEFLPLVFFTLINHIWVGDRRTGILVCLLWKQRLIFAALYFLRMLRVCYKNVYARWVCAKKLSTHAECAIKKWSTHAECAQTNVNTCWAFAKKCVFAFSAWVWRIEISSKAVEKLLKLLSGFRPRIQPLHATQILLCIWTMFCVMQRGVKHQTSICYFERKPEKGRVANWQKVRLRISKRDR